MIRAVAALCLLVAAAAAGDGAPLTEEQRAEAVRVVGAEAWGELPAWRQRFVLDRYALFVAAPERRREAILRMGLREFLLQPPRPAEDEKLPPALAEAVDRLPPRARPVAGRFAYVRLRQLRLDRSLARIPFAERRELFFRLFPEPFDQAAANAAHEELRRRAAREFALALKEDLARRDPPLPPEELREFVRRASAEDEERIFERIRAEIARLEGADPDRAERALGPFLADPLENLRFVTPRQRELIRYAIRPEDCPLLDLAYLGPRPEEPAERRLWDRDYRTLARLELLSDAGFGREMVLHLAGAGSPEDFLRAIQNLRRPPARK